MKKAKEKLTLLSNQWKDLNPLKKIDRMLTYTILAALLLAVVPAVTLQMQLYRFQKTLAEQNLQRCESQIVETVETKTTEEETFLYSAPKEDSAEVATVKGYFDAFNRGNMYAVCDTLSDSKCVAENPIDIARAQSLKNNLVNGYENLHLWDSERDEDFHSDVVCVQYDYTYKNDTNQKKITELMSYYVQDGEITARVCESVLFDGEKADCPVLSARDFCL